MVVASRARLAGWVDGAKQDQVSWVGGWGKQEAGPGEAGGSERDPKAVSVVTSNFSSSATPSQ